MIISLTCILIALVYLMFETHGLTIRLESYEKPQSVHSDVVNTQVVDDTDTEPITAIVEHKTNFIPVALLNPAYLYKPSEFKVMPMPELSGNINIMCKKE
jgi:hypothetical protein